MKARPLADCTLLSLSDLHSALKEKGLSISGKTLQRRSDEMGLAFGRFNGQRVYRPRDVPKIAERLSHYRTGNLPRRGRPKEALTLLSLPDDHLTFYGGGSVWRADLPGT